LKKILVIQTAFIGDAILASSLLESIHASDQETEIHLLLRNGNESLYDQHPFLKKAWVWNKTQKYKSLFSLIGQIRKEKFDEVVNLQRFASSGIMTAFSGANKTYGFNKNPLSFLFSKSLPHELGKKGDLDFKHEVERNNTLIADRFNTFIKKPKLYPTEQQKEKVKPYQSSQYITMSPSSVWFTKQWPKEKWLELISKNTDVKIYLLGAPGDKDYLETFATQNHKNIEVLAGKLSLLESAALMKNAQMNYVNDSAPMHLASSINAPVTAIYCSTIPEFGFGPLSDESHIWQSTENLNCRPCGIHGFKSCPKGHFSCAKIQV
jgi:heptosyltransferase-2